MKLLTTTSLVLVAFAAAACTTDADESASSPAPEATQEPAREPDLGRTADAGQGPTSKQVTKPAPGAAAKLTRTATWVEDGEDRNAWISDELVVEFEPADEGRDAMLRADSGATEVPQRQEGVRLWRVSPALRTDDLAREATTERARFSPVLHATDSPTSPKSALPGGVLVTFPSDWDKARIDAWFAERGRKAGTEAAEGTNIYLVPTPPGLAALEACSELARADERVTCEPNWWQEPSAR